MLGIKCPCSLRALQIRCYSQGGGARPAHVLGTEMVLARTFSRQEVGNWFLAAGTDTIACVADEPDAEILFSSLEKSNIILIITVILITNIILIINYFWCILIYFYFFFLGQVTCTASQVTAPCSIVNPRVGNNQSVHWTIYINFFYSCHFVLD